MIINRANLDLLYTGYNTAYKAGVNLMEADSLWKRVAQETQSMASEEVYPWLGRLPGMRKWVGERVVNQLTQHSFRIVNEDYEDTIAVPRNDIVDDKYGVYTTFFQQFGGAVAAHPDELVWPLLASGFDTVCWDGQYFFDSDHPVILSDGQMGTISNTGGGAGTAWYLMDLRMATRMPLIFQRRERADDVIRMDDPRDESVFRRREFEYGVHCRDNAGFGWWQLAYGSKQALTAANYAAAREAMMAMKGDHGRPLGLMPNVLVVPPSLDYEARQIVTADRNAAGATNVLRGTAEVLTVPWLA